MVVNIYFRIFLIKQYFLHQYFISTSMVKDMIMFQCLHHGGGLHGRDLILDEFTSIMYLYNHLRQC